MKSTEAMFFKAISRCRAAQQRMDKRLGGATVTFRCRPFFESSAGQSRILRDQVNGCTFFGSFLYASKEMNVKNTKNFSGLFVIILINVLLFAGSVKGARGQDVIRVAVATNFIRTMEKIAGRYEAETGNRLKLSSGSTGMLYARIINYAPYDIFLAADEKRPEVLHQKGFCEAPFAYATGKVVLWSNRKGLNEKENWRQIIIRDDVSRIAIANPETAPYGEAAIEALRKTGLEQGLKNRLVYGQNVGQAFQYGQQGAVDMAFIAFSLALSEHGMKGETWLLPEALPVVQKGCVLKSAANEESVHDFIAFLQTVQAKTIVSEFGYE